MQWILLALLLLTSLPLETKAEKQDQAVEMTVVLKIGDREVSLPRLMTRSGQKGQVESGREFAHRGGDKITVGVVLQSCSTVQENRLTSSGMVALRELLWKKHQTKGNFAEFETREVLFDLQAEDGETVEIPLSDGSKARATFRIVPCDS